MHRQIITKDNMNNADFWASIKAIIAEGFTPEGLQKLDHYAGNRAK